MNVPVPLIATLVGSFLGFVISLTFGVVSKWRQSEQRRHRVRSFLALLSIELEARKNCLINKGRVPERVDWEAAKPPFKIHTNYHDVVDDYRLVFDNGIEILGSIEISLATKILDHYQKNSNYLDREYQYLEDVLSSSYGTKQKQEFFMQWAEQKGNQVTEIIQDLERESLSFSSQSFFAWLRMWLAG